MYIFQLFLVVLLIFFVIPFFYFLFRLTVSRFIGEFNDFSRVSDLFFSFLPRARARPVCECGCIYESLFSYSSWWIQRMEHLCRFYAWLYFPGIKVGKLFISILPFLLFAGVFFNRDIVRRTIIPSLARLLTGTVFSCRFFLLRQGSLNISFVERL